jgi:hypothetical protein
VVTALADNCEVRDAPLLLGCLVFDLLVQLNQVLASQLGERPVEPVG